MNKNLADKYLRETVANYDLIAKEFSDTRFRPWPEMFELVKQFVKEGDSVLDIGCGNGRLINALNNLNKINYLGIDNSQHLLQQAQKQFPKQKFQTGEILDLSKLGSQLFDEVFLIAVLHHVPSTEYQLQSLKEVAKHLKPNGYLIMENWNLKQPRFWWHWIHKYVLDPKLGFKDLLIPWKKLPESKQKVQIWRYCHSFSRQEIAQLLHKANFRLVQQHYIKNGVKSSWWHGHNLVTVAQKC